MHADAKLFPADEKLRPQGRIQAKPGGGVTTPSISENKKGPPGNEWAAYVSRERPQKNFRVTKRAYGRRTDYALARVSL